MQHRALPTWLRPQQRLQMVWVVKSEQSVGAQALGSSGALGGEGSDEAMGISAS